MDHVKKANFLVPVVGTYYRSQPEKQFYNSLRKGAKLLLIPDSTNKFDKNAIKVMSYCNKHLGWLSKEDAARVHNLICQAEDDDDFQSNRFTSVRFKRDKIVFTALVSELPKSTFERMMLSIIDCDVNHDYVAEYDPRDYDVDFY